MTPNRSAAVLDGAFEWVEALQLRADDPRRVAFDEVATAVGASWYPKSAHIGSISLSTAPIDALDHTEVRTLVGSAPIAQTAAILIAWTLTRWSYGTV